MFSQAIGSSEEVKRYDIIVSSAPYIEASGYIDNKIIKEALKSSLTYVGVCKSAADRYRFFADNSNKVLTCDGKFNLEINVSRAVCVVCKTIKWPDINTFSTTSDSVTGLAFVPMENTVYICCGDSCAEVLKANPLPYI